MTTTGFAQVRWNPSPTSVWDGRLTIYFNGSADKTRSDPENTANDLENLEQRVIDYISSAQQSIDIAAFELNSLNIVVALCKARARGVRVRIIIDDEHAPNNNPPLWKTARGLLQRYKIPFLSDAGWPAVNTKDRYFRGYRGLMHHKFLVIDAISPAPQDDIVITGSYNFTITGMVSMQNLVVIRDSQIAGQFEEEFEEMWGSRTEQPNTDRAKFHQYKTFNVNPSVSFGRSSVQAFFAPSGSMTGGDDLLARIADLITREANHDIRVCSFSFSTGIEIDDAIRQKFELEGVDVKAVFDKTSKSKYSLYAAMARLPIATKPWNRSPEAYLAREDRQLHHKYILIDAENPDPNDTPIVVTGSFNFSKNANETNDDNFVVIRDRRAANQFLQEFYARFDKAKADAVAETPVIESDEQPVED